MSIADACIGATIGLFDVGEPLPLSQTVFIVDYGLVCSLGINDVINVALISRHHHHHHADS